MSTLELSRYCNSSNDNDNSIAIGYVVSIADNSLLRPTEKFTEFCIPKSIGRKMMLEKVCDYIRTHDSSKKDLAAYTVRRAFQEYFPCHERINKVG